MGLGDLSPEDNGDNGGGREYAQPTKAEFEDCLKDARGDWFIDNDAPGMEFVYDTHDFSPDRNGIVLRVYSTIDKRTGQARGKGEDAIRLVVFNRHEMKPMAGKKKTLRIKTYCKNLKRKIREMFEEADDYVTECNECGSWMVVRSGPHGQFLGCSNYPDCDNTSNNVPG